MIGSLDKIEKKIRENAEREVAAINAEADKKIALINDEIEHEALKAYNEVKKARKNEVELIPRRILSEAQMERKRQVNTKKAEILDSVFEEAKNRIMKMNKKEKAKIMKSLAEDAAKNIKEPVFFVDKQYADLLEGAKTEDIGDFGVIARSKDGSASVDNTLNSVMARYKTALKPQLVKILFKEA